MSKKKQQRKEKKSNRANKEKRVVSYFDYSLLAVLVFLISFGLAMLYSSSSYSALIKYNDSMYYLKRQVIFTIAGFVIGFVAMMIPMRMYRRLAWPLYWLSLFMMALVRFTPLGKEVNGAKRWIRLPMDQQLQPAEIAKIAVILLIPLLIIKAGKSYRKVSRGTRILAFGVIAAAGALFLTDNLSTAIIIVGICAVIVFVSHPKAKAYVKAFVALLGVAGVGILVLSSQMATHSDFRLRRILVWLHPEEYASEGGYQVMQGLYAIGSGGLLGKGFGNSTQKMVIPEVQNDMILSVICEELGIFGAMMVLLLFGLILYRLLFIAQNAPDMYCSLVVTGIFGHIALQVILNVAVVVNLIPTTGITLPFISYGGTSTLFLMAEMGIALGVSRRIKLP